MCYDEEYNLRKQLRLAQRHGASDELIAELTERIYELTRIREEGEETAMSDEGMPVFHHVSGFSHPIKVVFGAVKPFKAQVAEWGFVPPWAKTIKEAYDPTKPYNNSLNAQAGGIFEKKTFAFAAKYGRCVVALDSYYEHHDYKGKKYPFRIFMKDGSPLYVAAIANKNRLLDEETGEVVDKLTVATLTTSANPLLARIHNNPELVKRAGHRMLVILEESQFEEYLQPYPYKPKETADPQVEAAFQKKILDMCVPYDETKLGYHSVRNLRSRKGMDYIGNVPAITENFVWPDLDYSRIENPES